MQLNKLYITLLTCAFHLSNLSDGKALPVGDVQECGSDKVYIQWRDPASGWYYLNEGRFERHFPTYPGKYDFSRKRGSDEWTLREWTETWEIIPIWTGPADPFGIGVKTDKPYTNVFKASPQAYPHNSRSSLSSTVPRNHLGDDDTSSATSNNNQETQVKVHSRTFKGNDIFFPTLKVFCPGRCVCKRAILPELGLMFNRSDLVVESTLSRCRPLLFSIFGDILSTRFPNGPPLDRSVGHSNSDHADETRTSRQWKPEAYMTNECDLLYFNEEYDLWGIYMPGNATFGSGFILGMDSGPCLELLPEGASQSWEYTPLDDNSRGLNNKYYQAVEIIKSKDLQLLCDSIEESDPVRSL